MIVEREYIAVHEQLLHRIEDSIDKAVCRLPTRFQSSVDGLSLSDGLGVTISEFDRDLYDDEQAMFMEAQARIRGLGLYGLLAVNRVINDPEAVLNPIDEMTDDMAIIIEDEDGDVVELSRTFMKSGSEVAVSHQAKHASGGVVSRLTLTTIDGVYVQVKDEVSFQHDPELERVFSFLLPNIETEVHALLVNLLCGRVKNIEGTASVILSPYIGTSQEEEATRILDIVVDRAMAARSVKSMGLIAMGLPSATRLQDWADLLTFTE